MWQFQSNISIYRTILTAQLFVGAWPAVAAPGRQGSQVISRSLRSWGRSSGANASAVKKPGHFEVRKSSSQVTRCIYTLFSSKKLTTFFSRHPQNTGRQHRWLFHCQNKTNKAVRYGNIFIFSSHYYRSNRQGWARAVDLPARYVIWHGAPWCSAATDYECWHCVRPTA